MGRRNLKNMRAILTGASSGLGLELARELSAAGVRLVLNARRVDKLESLAKEISAAGGECFFVPGDISEPNVRSQLVEACVEQLGGIDCVLNNAGVGAMGRFDEASPERIRKVFEVNFFAATELTRICLPHLVAGNDSLVVNIGSVLGHRGAPLKSEYSASKFALHGFSDALRAELSKTGVGVLLVSPSTIDSGFFDASIEDKTGRNWVGRNAMSPEYVAGRVVRAMIGRRHEIILPFSGKVLVWLDRLLPGLANRLVARYGQ